MDFFVNLINTSNSFLSGKKNCRIVQDNLAILEYLTSSFITSLDATEAIRNSSLNMTAMNSAFLKTKLGSGAAIK